MKQNFENRIFKVPHLGEAKINTPLNCICFQPDDEYVADNNVVSIKNDKVIEQSNIFLEVTGPKPKIFFDPAKTRVGIVTCGGEKKKLFFFFFFFTKLNYYFFFLLGLAPGLNNVIRGITLTLFYRYGVKDIFGFKFGYQGLTKGSEVIHLTPGSVKDIHHIGGTILGTSRGIFLFFYFFF